MKIYRNLEDSFTHMKNPVVTIGNFDGVHGGHLEILKEMKDIALLEKGETVVITFNEHPKNFFVKGAAMKVLSSIDEKIEIFDYMGIDHLVILDFDQRIASMDASDFLNEILLDKMGTKHIVMGYDHSFGKDRGGNIDFLMDSSLSGGERIFNMTRIDPHIIDDSPISSTRIRHLLKEGNISGANFLLAREYGVTGEVVKGFGRGKEIGFPTANIKPAEVNKVIPCDGVYAVEVYLQGFDKLYGMLNIGTNPTFENDERSIEVNIFDFNSDIYYQDITVKFVEKIRAVEKFDSIDELIDQIKKDKQVIKKFFLSDSN